MNLSRAISQLKMQFNLYQITLPFKDNITGSPMPTENVIRDVLTITTIPTYSQFVPWIRETYANVRELECVDERDSIYLLPPVLTITPVMYVMDIDIPAKNKRGTFGDVTPAYGINRSVHGTITSQAYMMLAGQIRSEPTFNDLGDNKIQLFGYPNTRLYFKVACEHAPNGETIPNSCYDSFMQLATVDLKMFLYNTLKLYDGMPSAFGPISLKSEDYQGAEQERHTLLETWRDRFHLDMIDWFEFM